MTNYYSFIGLSINFYLETHQISNYSIRISPQDYYSYCHPLQSNFTLQFYTFQLLTEHIRAVSINQITYLLFQELIQLDFTEIHISRLKQRIVQLVNTFLFDRINTQEEQLDLIEQFY